MRLTKQSSYAVRALIYCAAAQPNLCRVADIAAAYDISETFLFKLLKPLVDAQILETVRGRNGGVRLARPAAEISLLAVIQATEDNFCLSECFEEKNGNCPLVDNCEFKRALESALFGFFEALDRFSIADLAANPPDIRERLKISA